MADIEKPTRRWLASENIKLYERQIQQNQGEERRRILQKLIEEERNKLDGPSE